MLRVFLIAFIVSLTALGGTYYWRTYHPRLVVKEWVSGPRAARPLPNLREKAHSTAKKLGKGRRYILKRLPSGMQTWATIFSIVSSTFTALGALVSGYFAWMRYRAVRSVAPAGSRK